MDCSLALQHLVTLSASKQDDCIKIAYWDGL